VIWLLDTNIIIHALNGVGKVRDRLNAAQDSDRILTSTIVVAELVYGAECSTRREENRRSIQQKLSQIEVIPVTPAIADRFGVVKAQLRSRGRLKADFDLMIAATALELGATLVTDDGPLLGCDIAGLLVDNWVG
jgi:tRNA(fMet)-specific endonuclease VapC